jgi:hypothetical protein
MQRSQLLSKKTLACNAIIDFNFWILKNYWFAALINISHETASFALIFRLQNVLLL